LALNIIRQLESEKDNVFFSPLSLSSAFGMLYYGAKSETAKELRAVLGYDTAGLPDPLVHETFRYYLKEKLSGNRSYVLNLANAVLLDKKLDLVPSYKTDVEELYRANVEDVDFSKEAARAVIRINEWVEEKTQGKIEKLLDELDPSTVLVLLNAVYFKGTWKTQFDPTHTKPKIFYQNGIESDRKRVPMMKLKERLPYAEFYDFQAVELPYVGGDMSMIVILPRSLDGLQSAIKDMTMEKLNLIMQQLEKVEVHLTMPKFKIEYEKEMSENFQDLGVKSVFRPGADFSGLAKDKNIFVTQVLHKAVVEVNEEGSEAAAVTGIISNRMRPIFDTTPEIVVDHPFLFTIVDKRNDMIIFLGRVNKL